MVIAKARAIRGSWLSARVPGVKPLRRMLCPLEAKAIYSVNQVLIFLHFRALISINKISWSHKKRTKYVIIYDMNYSQYLLQFNLNPRTVRRWESCTPSFFLNISVARQKFPLRFVVFLEPSKRDGMTLIY